MSQLTFNEVEKKHLKTLEQYVPVVARVHGDSHPEFHELHKVFKIIVSKIKESRVERPLLLEEFKKLREITDSYKIPEGVCESYEAVYNMLEELDKAYQV